MLSSKGVLWDVLRPIVAWPMRSPTRLIAVAVSVLVLVVVAAQINNRQGRADSVVSSAAPTSSLRPAAEPDAARSTAWPTASSAKPDGDAARQSDADAASATVGDGHSHGEGSDDGHDEGWVTMAPGESYAYAPEGSQEEEIADVGVAAVSAMARPESSTSEQKWWSQFAVHLTKQARQDYTDIDPETVPWSKVTDKEGLLVPAQAEAELVQLVEVETDEGWVTAHVRREGKGWAVSRISWPQEGPEESVSG